MTEEEVMDESTQRVALWDTTDSGVMYSVHAYLMWHSGSVFRNSIPDREQRTIYLDMRADEAEEFASRHGLDMSDRRRVESITSLDSQTQHEPGEAPVCYLDVELIEQGLALPPSTPPQGITLEPLEVGWPRYNDYDEFRRAYRDLGYYIKHYPGEVDYHFQRLQRSYLRIANYHFHQEVDSFHFIPPEFHIIGVPDDRRRQIAQLNLAHDVGQTIVLRGQIIEISEPKTTYTSIAWKCKDANCRTVHFVEQDANGMVTKPEPSCGKFEEMEHGESNGCTSKHFLRLPPPMSNATAIQRLTLQEEELTNGEARTITLEIRGSLTEKMVAGQGVEVVGALLTEPVTKGSLLENKYVLVKSVTERSDVISNIAVTEGEREEIRAFVAGTPYQERMKMVIDSWAGRVYAEDHIKEAIILQSCGGTYNAYSETRGTMHILIVGDPGTAKTKLLQLAAKLHPGSRFVQADVTTQAGLTAACSQVEDMYTGKKKWALVPGALALTHPEAVCAVDEFNLYKGDFGDFNNAMESGEVFVNKVVKGRVVTAAPVLAGANPNNGNKKKWLRGEQVSYSDQIGLEFTMLQRFTIIFILEDTPDYNRDENIALSMTKGISVDMVTAEDETELSMDFIQRYLAVARSVNPLLNEEAQRYIAKSHADKRKENGEDSADLRSHRQVNSLWRLASAVARFELAEVITKDHIALAEKILAESLEEKDPGLLTTGVTKADRELQAAVEEGIIHFFQVTDSEDGFDLPTLHGEVSKSISGWRTPSLMEFENILIGLTQSGGKGFMQAGEKYYKWEE
jgi:replicative DNA helicase Mcm